MSKVQYSFFWENSRFKIGVCDADFTVFSRPRNGCFGSSHDPTSNHIANVARTVIPILMLGNPRGGCNAGSVPLDVFDALEEDLGLEEGGARVNASEDGSRNTFNRSECASTSSLMTSNLLCVSEMLGGLHVRFPMIHRSGHVGQLRIRRFQSHPRCQQSHHCPHGLMAGVPEMSLLQETVTVNLLWPSGQFKRRCRREGGCPLPDLQAVQSVCEWLDIFNESHKPTRISLRGPKKRPKFNMV